MLNTVAMQTLKCIIALKGIYIYQKIQGLILVTDATPS